MMRLTFDPYLRKREKYRGWKQYCVKQMSVVNSIKNTRTYSSVRNSSSDHTSIVCLLALSCLTHSFQRSEACELACTRCPSENWKAVQGSSNCESDRVQAPFGIANVSCFPCLLTPPSSKMTNSSAFICRAMACFSRSLMTKRTSKKSVFPIKFD